MAADVMLEVLQVTGLMVHQDGVVYNITCVWKGWQAISAVGLSEVLQLETYKADRISSRAEFLLGAGCCALECYIHCERVAGHIWHLPPVVCFESRRGQDQQNW